MKSYRAFHSEIVIMWDFWKSEQKPDMFSDD